MKIRNFEMSDLPRLQEIRAAAFEPVFRSFRDLLGKEIARLVIDHEERGQGEYLDTICRERSGDMFVVEDESQIVAFCAVLLSDKSKVGEIDLNAVDPAYQGNGVGALMYEHALERMKAAGMLVAEVSTGGDLSHEPARAAYRKVGFGPSIPSVHMYRTL